MKDRKRGKWREQDEGESLGDILFLFALQEWPEALFLVEFGLFFNGVVKCVFFVKGISMRTETDCGIT